MHEQTPDEEGRRAERAAHKGEGMPRPTELTEDEQRIMSAAGTAFLDTLAKALYHYRSDNHTCEITIRLMVGQDGVLVDGHDIKCRGTSWAHGQADTVWAILASGLPLADVMERLGPDYFEVADAQDDPVVQCPDGSAVISVPALEWHALSREMVTLVLGQDAADEEHQQSDAHPPMGAD